MTVNYAPHRVYKDIASVWFHRACRNSLRMAAAYHNNRHLRVLWQERAADYRECVVEAMRRRQGWSLAERVAGKREG